MLDSEQPSDAGTGPDEQGIVGVAETTGRFIVVFAEDDDGRSDSADAERILRSLTGVSNIASARDLSDAAPGDYSQLESADATWIPDLGVAVVSMDPADAVGLQAAESSQGQVLVVEPELVHHVLAPTATDYLTGYQDAVIDLTHRLGGAAAGAAPTRPVVMETFADTAQLTWGLQATGVGSSSRTGAGVKVAVLDTGFDLTHPDFAGRAIQSQSFVAGQAVQDEHGHGTHCVGTSCGPRSPAGTRRYGCASEAEIFVGKVLSNGGSGTDSGILLGIDWALSNGCDIISMSLGAEVAAVSKTYEAVGARALRRKSVIVAAAGNNAHRPSDPGFVGVPANSPSIVAVAALDSQLAVAPFSARTNTVRGGQVDIAGPGVGVFSSWPMSKGRYRSISGTSMATPHVAGIAALWAEATGRRGRGLWCTLTAEARRQLTPSVDVGAGMVQAPQ
jgi:subtilisin family serine protease